MSNCNCKEISISNRRKYIIFHRLLCWPNTKKYINFGKLVKMKVKKQFLLMNLLQNCFPSKMQTQNIVRSKYQWYTSNYWKHNACFTKDVNIGSKSKFWCWSNPNQNDVHVIVTADASWPPPSTTLKDKKSCEEKMTNRNFERCKRK